MKRKIINNGSDVRLTVVEDINFLPILSIIF